MNNLNIKGRQKFMDLEIPVIEGGFGEDKKCMTDKTIAEMHNMETKNVRARINSNIARFKKEVDYIDLKVAYEVSDNLQILKALGYSNMQISKADNIYLLSERGYSKLIKIMDTDLAWEIHDKIMDEYFNMREHFIDSYMIQDSIERAKRWIEEEKERLLLKETIQVQQPKVEYHDKVLNPDKLVTTTDIAKDLGMTAQALNKLLHLNRIIYPERINGRIKCWKPYKNYLWLIPEYADFKITEHDTQLKWTEIGRKWLIEFVENIKKIS
ncbi:phage antirepressor KilAC domain-containing protein [Clostridioides difficile]|uniref:phage antirepressor KilAC domain-containing protein n=1 Tax=Clostridioides difficile TaxID=1496 RepID=UPI00038DA304|nr:phage antirepressor KilAC domain-containing protein [Clostridioides difficile]EIS9524025.1 phage antirepressor KilAC domain-containing protein [Clostridioides difficile]EIS9625602.1 phage antirepressor KilAC domain-containing protein [Clostridioides difficile]EJX3464987.1 phage antirepressor KilAC domain-containing protein [Clostridioides difficile]EQJ88591.1 phage antirepressor KilAC domain protein [Clostridioides difficile P50]MBY2508822.1 phage antirepressor KilAC domain-containing prote